MGIQLKKDEVDLDEMGLEISDDYKEGFGSNLEETSDTGMFKKQYDDPGDINDLPPYTAPIRPEATKVARSSAETRSIIYKVVGVIIVLAVIFALYKGINYMTGSSGKDISDELTKTEEEISKDLKITFADDNGSVGKVPQYSRGKVTVRSGKELSVVYINGKQVGLNTDSRKYRFFGVGINDPKQSVTKKMTYMYDDTMVILNDLLGGKSTTYFYYNKKNNDCFAVTVNDGSNRVVLLTYFTDYKKISANLTSTSDE